MRCIIPGRSVKVFAKAIHCLSKIGDELYVEALSQGLALRTVNSSRSAYACFLFNESFFVSYDDGSKDLPDDSQAEDLLRCKIAMKSCMSAFKSMNTIEKTVDQCKIELNVREARLVFLLFCRHGITKTYNLTFQECETLQAVFSKDLSPNFITAQAKVLSDTVFNFPNNQEELTLVVCPETFKVKNYVDDEPDPNKVIHTEMVLVPEEFDNYQIGLDTNVTFCLKELRAILTFAEFASQPINVHFETGGKPIVFSMDGDSTYEADFVLATLVDNPSSSESSQASVTAASSTSAKKTDNNKDVSSCKTRPVEKASRQTARGQRKRATRQDGNSSNLDTSRSAGQTAVSHHDVTAGCIDNDNDYNDSDGDLKGAREVDRILSDNKKNKFSSGNLQDNHIEPTKPDANGAAHLLNQSNSSANKSSVLDDFFSDSFPYPELLAHGNKELSVIHEASQESADRSVRGSARPIQTPPSSVTDVSFLKNVDMPSLGDSCVSPEINSLSKQTRKQETNADDSLMDVAAEDDYDFIPGTPPHKKFKSMFFSASESQAVSEGVVLAADSDED